MPGDVTSGEYGLISPIQAALGLPGNSVQSNLPVRTNAEWMGLNDLTDQAAALGSGELTYVPIPVTPGTPIAKISMAVCATAASTPTHSFAALYAGTLTKIKLIGEQSADGTTTAIAASTRFDFVLPKMYIVQPADCEHGYIYAGISVTASSVPSLLAGAVATACQKAWFTNTPLKMAAKAGSSLGATAESEITIASATAIANPPIVFAW